MKRIKIIENPKSGMNLKNAFSLFQDLKNIDIVAKLLLDDGHLVQKFQTQKKNDGYYEALKACDEGWDLIVVAGGDGTVSEVLSAVASCDQSTPIAIYSQGTVNDFANVTQCPSDPNEFANMIRANHQRGIDLGKTIYNSGHAEHFVNVAAAGFLTNVPHQTSRELKNALGKLAYFLEGFKEAPKQLLKPLRVNVMSKEIVLQDEEIFLFLISNSSSIGGFKNAMPFACISDGYLDCLIVKKSDPLVVLDLVSNFLLEKHMDNPSIINFRTKKLTIESANPAIDIDIDIDGEFAGKLPRTFEICHNVVNLIVPKSSEGK